MHLVHLQCSCLMVIKLNSTYFGNSLLVGMLHRRLTLTFCQVFSNSGSVFDGERHYFGEMPSGPRTQDNDLGRDSSLGRSITSPKHQPLGHRTFNRERKSFLFLSVDDFHPILDNFKIMLICFRYQEQLYLIES